MLNRCIIVIEGQEGKNALNVCVEFTPTAAATATDGGFAFMTARILEAIRRAAVESGLLVTDLLDKAALEREE